MDLQKKPTAKKTFSLDDFKKKQGLVDAPDKPTEFIKISDAFSEATGLPGVPKGYTTLFRGFSNTGKSTALCETIVAYQKAGVLPVLIDTENNLGMERLKTMGFDPDNCISLDNSLLLSKYGKAKDATKEEATIEDMSDAINDILDMQKRGEIPFELLFAIDSLGTLDCDMTVRARLNDTSNNNMWNAGAFERSFKALLNYRIPNSRKTNSQYTNTLIGVQKIWLEANPVGQPTVRHKGGDAFLFGARLIFHIGGKKTQGIKQIAATSKGKEIIFGAETSIEAVKNQIDGPYGGISVAGKIISTPHGFIAATPDSINSYKKENLSYFRDKLGDVNAADITTRVDPNSLSDDDAKALFNEL